MGGEKGRGREERKERSKFKKNNNRLKVVIMNQD